MAVTDESDAPGHFYRPLGGDVYESTSATTSPWDPALQHGGPPSALLARAIEQAAGEPGLVVARFSVDFFGGVPQGRIRVTARVIRPGRRIELVEATLQADDQVVAVARAWRVKPSPDPVVVPPELSPPLVAAVARPAAQPPQFFPGFDPDWGYGRAIDWRFVEGSFAELGRAVVWTRVRVAIVEGEAPSGLQRMVAVADSINGLSAVLDLREWLFIPPGVTVHAQRTDADEWLLLAASTTVEAGIGVAQATLSDARGPLGLVTQPLLIQRR